MSAQFHPNKIGITNATIGKLQVHAIPDFIHLEQRGIVNTLHMTMSEAISQIFQVMAFIDSGHLDPTYRLEVDNVFLIS